MGCDIHSYVEIQNSEGEWEYTPNIVSSDSWERDYYKRDYHSSPFNKRCYGVFGFLANVRNYSCVPSILNKNRGLPSDLSKFVSEEAEYWDTDGHSHSWLTVEELINFDYDQEFWNRRITVQTGPNSFNGAGLAVDPKKEGKHETIRDFLGKWFFKHLQELQELGQPDKVRVVFWFDN